jgi:hypothetical protein
MARLIPEADEAELETWPSHAEQDVYRACRELPAGWLVLHGLRTLEPDDRGIPRDGEADFILFDPARGMLCIEVKGGGIRYDAHKREWFGHDKDGRSVWRADPFQQAMKRKKDVARKLTAAPEWKAGRLGALPTAHAVIFPDIDDVAELRRPDAPPDIVGGRGDVTDLEGWINRVYEYWAVAEGRPSPFPEAATTIVERILAAPFAVEPRLGVRIAREHERRNYWTDRQWDIMCSWPERDRIAIRGGAGTGKTVLAVRRAQQLADEGKTVALICFNTPLADHLRLENLRYTVHGGNDRDAILTMSFNSFARYWVQEVRDRTGRDHLAAARRHHPGRDENAIQLPIALAWALDDARPELDAVIVDEGQDFGIEDWNAVETLSEGRHLAILYDPNQAVFRRAANFPIGENETFQLNRNCRNTGPIHDTAYVHYVGPRVGRPELEGVPVRTWEAGDVVSLAANVAALVASERVRPEDIAVLLLDARRRVSDGVGLVAALGQQGVPSVEREHGRAGQVLVETVGRFKGLEAPVVVLWANGSLPDNQRRKFLYVAKSRAKSVLVLAGPADWLRAE